LDEKWRTAVRHGQPFVEEESCTRAGRCLM
jgi:hypothetical protein